MNFISTTKGAAVITSVILLLGLSLIITSAGSRIVVGEASRSESYIDSQENFRIAESAAEDVLYRLKKGYTISSSEVVPVASSSATVGISTAGSLQTIGATSTSPRATRAIGLSVFKGTGVEFFYGIQAGVSGITMHSSAVINGNAFSGANITGFSSSRITGSASSVGTISSPNPIVTGAKTTGVAPVPLPEFDSAYWKAQANINNDPHIGNLQYNSGSNTLGPKKIQGNLTLNSSSRLTLLGPIHVTGNLSLNSSSQLYVDPSFGSQGLVVVVDGTISINSSANVHATPSNPKGYLLLVSLSTSNNAVQLNSSATAEALILAPNGSVQMNSSAKATSVAGKGITLNSSATITYDLGLADASFSTGPSGAWEIEGWGETQ